MKNFFSALLLLLGCINAAAQNTEVNQKFAPQLNLVNMVRAYLQQTLHLNTGKDFYTRWAAHTDSMYFYVYVSKADSVSPFPPNTLGYTSYRIEDSAKLHQQAFQHQGYQTLLYKTSGTSDAELTAKLLSYPDEAIVFIMAHEATHRHISSLHVKPGYPYDDEESLCDAVANMVCDTFASRGLLHVAAEVKQKQGFENAYSFINYQRQRLDTASASIKPLIFSQTTDSIKTLEQNGNRFQQDRMLYPVNNAYFLRVEAYAKNYFVLKNMLIRGKSITSIVKRIYRQYKIRGKK